MEKIDVLIYKHVAADIEAVVDPETLDLVSCALYVNWYCVYQQGTYWWFEVQANIS